MASAGRRAITVIAALGSAAALFATASVSTAEAASSSGVATTTVNIRTGASTSATVVGRLVRGQQIKVTGEASGEWVKVRFRSGTAYMDGEYLDRSGARPAAPQRLPTAGTRIATAELNIRSGASSRDRAVGELAEGSTITLTGRYGRGYAEFRHQGSLRWVYAAYLAESVGTSTSPSPGPRPSPPRSSSRRRSPDRPRGRSPSRSVGPSSVSRTSTAPRVRTAGTARGSPRPPGARPGSRSPAPRTPR